MNEVTIHTLGANVADTLQKFGRFFLLDLLAQGGMADIYRARHATPTGGGRLLAIKRIQASYSANPEFINMFRGETKVTSGFTHPNIVQVYDYGEEQNQLYIAMEYVDGRNLRQYLSRLADLKQVFPIEVCCFIIEQAAQALHYAHEFKDKFSGKSLNIIHRDISPQNILISYDGAIKVIDFGIAKTETHGESTRAGVIKGKPAYLSPEQILGEALDGRSDVFALGAVFWELLTGKKLFAGDNDLAVIRMVENCNNYVKPPSLTNPKIPKELDAIILKTLEKDRQKRYQSALDLQRAIHKFLYQFAPEFNPADLSHFAKECFKKEILEDRKRLLKLNEKAEQLLASAELTQIAQPTQPKPAEQEATQHISQSELNTKSQLNLSDSQQALPELELSAEPPAPVESANTSAPEPSIPELPKNASVANMKPAASNHSPKEVSKKNIDLAAPQESGTLTLELPSRSTKTGIKRDPHTKTGMNNTLNSTRTNTAIKHHHADSSSSPWLRVAILIILVGGGFYFYTQMKGQKNFTNVLTPREPASSLNQTNALPTNENVTSETNTEANTKTASSGSNESTIALHLNITPAGGQMQVKINGNEVRYTKGQPIRIPVDESFELSVARAGFESQSKTLLYERAKIGASQDTLMDIEMIPLKAGYLSLTTIPSADGIIYIDGGEEHIQTPLSGKRLPEGTYKIHLEHRLLKMSKDITVTIESNKVKRVEERLNDSGNEGNNSNTE